MEGKDANISIRTDLKLKEEAEKLFAELGMNMTTACNIFLRQAVREQKIPFEIRKNVLNQDTIEALNEANALLNDSNAKLYNNFSELLEEVRADV